MSRRLIIALRLVLAAPDDVRLQFISDLKKGKYKGTAFNRKNLHKEYSYDLLIDDKYLVTLMLVKQFRRPTYSGKPNSKSYFIGVNVNEIGTQNNSYSQIRIGKVVDDNSYSLDDKFDNFVKEKLGFVGDYNNIEVF